MSWSSQTLALLRPEVAGALFAGSNVSEHCTSSTLAASTRQSDCSAGKLSWYCDFAPTWMMQSRRPKGEDGLLVLCCHDLRSTSPQLPRELGLLEAYMPETSSRPTRDSNEV